MLLLRAIVTGLAIAAAGTFPWALLVQANMRYGSALPWAVPLMAAYLFLWWKFATGRWGWQTTASSRRANARFNRVSDQLWAAALFAGVLGSVDVLLLQGILTRLVAMPKQIAPDVSHSSLLMVASLVFMGAVVAGVVEETSFRGYMQRPIERRHGPVVAILVTGVVFGLTHFSHPEVTLVLLPYYVAVAAVYGAIAYFTDSVVPSMVLHAGGNMLGSFALIVRGRSEWQPLTTPPPPIWVTGVDLAFWGSLAAFFFVTAVTLSVFHALATAASSKRAEIV